jgi:hypothetical protein
VLPVESIEGDQITFGHQQLLTTLYIGVMRDGKSIVEGKVK